MRRLLTLIALVTVAAGMGVFFSRNVWFAYAKQREDGAEARQELKETDARRKALMEREAMLKSPVGREEHLRNGGYGKRNEVPLGKP